MKRNVLALLAAAALLGAWCDPHGNCGQPLPPRYGRPYPTELPYAYDRYRLPPTRTPQHLNEWYGVPYPHGYARPAPRRRPYHPHRHPHGEWW